MKLVALDVGEKRIGVATADSAVKIAVPRGVVEVDGDEFMQIVGIMRDEKAKHLIVGLPRNAQGEETAQSKAVRAFVAALMNHFVKQKVEKPLVKFQDESLTSVIAEEHLASKKKRKRRRQKIDIDSEAAAIILQDFLNSFGGEKAFPADAEVKKKKKKVKGKMKHKFLKILAVLVGLAMVAGVGAVTWYIEMLKPMVDVIDCDGINPEHASKCVSVDFVVAEKDSTSDIIDRLESEGLIRSALAFKIYLRLNNVGPVMRAGTYALHNYMSITEILDELKKGSLAETFRITFLPGATMADAKKRLLEAGVGYTEEAIDAALAAKYDHPVMEGKPDNGTLEGYIFGETYEFYTTATVEEVLERTFDELYKVVQENHLIAGFSRHGLSLYEGIVMASIIQREAPTDKPVEMQKVAQVFFKRLEIGMTLGSCAIIEYRGDQLGLPRNNALYSDLNVLKCPWSSRHCPGLPPQPISNPGKAALLSVVDPADTTYLFFLTDDDGNMRYAYTDAEHQNNTKNYCKVRCF